MKCGDRWLTICYRSWPRALSSILAPEDRAVDGCGGKYVETEIDGVEPDAPFDDLVEVHQKKRECCGLQSNQHGRKHGADRHVLVCEEQLGVIFEQVLERRHRQQNAEQLRR